VIRSIQSSHTFPLSAVKPLEELAEYRAFCLDRTREALRRGAVRRTVSPIDGRPLEPFASIDGFEYLRCRSTGSLFAADVAPNDAWLTLLEQVSRFRRSPKAFHTEIEKERADNVYAPKLEWIKSTLRLQAVAYPRMLEVVTPPSDFTDLLRASHAFAEVVTVAEMALVAENSDAQHARGPMHAAVLLDAVDRVTDPSALLRAVANRLQPQGLLFVTAQVSSGFDISTLGGRDLYLYPPDRTNCFSLPALETLLAQTGFTCLEVSTPGVLDVEVVLAHASHDPALPLAPFERQLIAAAPETRAAFQAFLQENRMSSFARVVARKAA
jgi:hypothetical protein